MGVEDPCAPQFIEGGRIYLLEVVGYLEVPAAVLLDVRDGGFLVVSRGKVAGQHEFPVALLEESPGRHDLSLIHISEPTRLGMISYAVFCLKKKKQQYTIQNNSKY